MILTERNITITNHNSEIDSPVVLYRGDKNVELKLNIRESKFKFRDDSTSNFIEDTQASYGQLIIETPNEKDPIFSEVTATKKGYIIFTITEEMIDEITEVGFYNFQVRLFDINKQSRATIPPVFNGIEIREPITAEDSNTLNSAVVGLASAANEEVLDTFDINGNYATTNWKFGDKITDAKLNKAEDGIYQSYALGLDNSFKIEKKASKQELEVERKRINNLATHIVEGSTTGDAELIDGRIGYDGSIYENIGTAIRSQIKPINDLLLNIEKDLDMYYYTKQNGHLWANTESNSMNYLSPEVYCSKSTNKISCSSGDVFIYEGVGRNRACSWVFFENNLIKETGTYEGKTEVVIPEGVNYVIFSSFCDIGSEPILNVEYTLSKNTKLTEHIQRIDTDIDKLFKFSELAPMLQKEVNAYGYYEHNGYLRVNTTSNELFFYIEDERFNCITTSAIRCSEGDVFEYFGAASANIVGWAFLDDNEKVISWDNNHCNDNSGAKELVTIPAGVSYVVFSSCAKDGKSITLEITYVNDSTVSSKINAKLDSIKNLAQDANICYYPNLFDKTKVVEGYISKNGTFTESTSYYTSDYILIEKGKTYTLSPKVRIIAYYDLDKTFITSDDTTKSTPYTFTVETDRYLRFCIYASSLNKFMVEEGETNTSYKPYELTLKNEVCFNALQKEYISSMAGGSSGNVLFGKKLVACGDSFTAGDFNGVTDENGLSGTASPIFYDSVRGCYKTYPWWIAERNNMTLVNEAKSGTTLTYLPDYTDAFSETRYQNIPADADYILIKFGINDDNNHKNAPIGTINDTTNETFYGAWNVVLEYLITNHPWAKIGIIVTNGCNANYATAIRESAKKWGIPYLDEANGENIPLLIRTNKSYVCAKARELRDNQMKLSDNNTHPNVKAHEYESTIVENFLRSL